MLNFSSICEAVLICIVEPIQMFWRTFTVLQSIPSVIVHNNLLIIQSSGFSKLIKAMYFSVIFFMLLYNHLRIIVSNKRCYFLTVFSFWRYSTLQLCLLCRQFVYTICCYVIYYLCAHIIYCICFFFILSCLCCRLDVFGKFLSLILSHTSFSSKFFSFTSVSHPTKSSSSISLSFLDNFHPFT